MPPPKPILLKAGLPPPEYLQAIEQIVPGSAKRLLEVFEEETIHRRMLEDQEIAFRFRGQIFGFIVCLAAFGVAGFAAYLQEPWIGSIVGGTTIIGIVSIFVLGRLVGDKKVGKPA
jgi:uncharacterized membrane protein